MNVDPWSNIRREAFNVGQLIRRRRVLAGITQTEFGRLIGLDAPRLSRIERGESIPHGDVAVRLVDWLMGSTVGSLQTSESDAGGSGVVSPPIVSPTPPRATHPDTSRKAMMSVDRDTASAIHQWIIDMLTDHPEGATHEQFWMLYTRCNPQPKSSQSGLRTRVSELVRGGVVQDSGRTRAMTTGRQAIVWTLTNQQETTT